MKPKYVAVIIIGFFLVLLVNAYAGEREDLKVCLLQNHVYELQLEFQATLPKLQQAVVEKQKVDEADKKAKLEISQLKKAISEEASEEAKKKEKK